MEGRVEGEVPHQGEGGQLGWPGQQEEGRLGLHQGREDGARVAIQETHQIDGQGAGPAELLHLVSCQEKNEILVLKLSLTKSESSCSTEKDAGGCPEAWEDWSGVDDMRDSLPHSFRHHWYWSSREAPDRTGPSLSPVPASNK